MIKALPTRYSGVTFRSRLEADYAHTFNKLGITWQYEPEGFELSDGTWYSPDFYLPGSRAWAEVKGDHDERISKVEQFAADLADSPQMVIMLRSGEPFAVYDDNLHWHPIGITGPGRRFSVRPARCPDCGRVTIIRLWQDACHPCGTRHDEPVTDWIWNTPDLLFPTLHQLPRPKGRGRR